MVYLYNKEYKVIKYNTNGKTYMKVICTVSYFVLYGFLVTEGDPTGSGYSVIFSCWLIYSKLSSTAINLLTPVC